MAATDLNELYEALRNAEAAGDTTAAQRLSDFIRDAHSESYQLPPRQQGEVEKFVRAAGSKVVDTATDLARSARNAFVGPSDLPDLPEFNAPSPTGTGTAKAALGLMMSNDPAAQADILKKQYPGIRLQPVKSEENDQTYLIADWTDEQGKRHRGYVNAPGFTTRDAAALAGQSLAYVPAARFGQGAYMLTGAARRTVPNLLGRMARTGAAVGATRAALDKGMAPLGSDQSVNWPEVGITATGGAAAEVAAPLVSGAYRAIRGNPLRSGDGLSGAGQRAAADAGLDVEGMSPEALREFARIAEGGNVAVAGRAAEMREFGIPASRGQLLNSADDPATYRQLNLEERMRRGLEGDEPGRIMREFDARQRAAIDEAANRVQGRLQPQRSADLSEAQGRFFGGVQQAEQAAERRVDDAYTAMRGMGDATVPVPAEGTLLKRLTDAVAEEARVIDPMLTPATVRALREVGERLPEGGASLADFEKARRVIVNLQQASPNRSDSANLTIVKRALDDWLDETVDAGLMSGDPAIVDALKAARAARAEYGRLFQSRGPNDVAGKIVERIIEKAETPEMAMNYILGQGSLAGQQSAVGATRKLKEILGADSDAWNALREAAWTRLARDNAGNPRSPTMFSKEWNNFNLRNRSLRDELFSPEEIALMNRYRQALGRTDRPPTNPSQSAFSFEEMVRYMLRRAGTAQTFQGSTLQGGILHSLARSPFNPLGMADWAKRRAAARALEPLPGGARPLVAPVAVGTPAAAELMKR